MADNLAVVLAAAGTGSRMESEINKQYMLLKGRPVICYSLDLFDRLGMVKEVIIVAHPGEVEYCESQIVAKYGYSKISRVVAGGITRQHSVWYGLNQVDKATDLVAVHDGARPLVDEDMFMDVAAAAREWGAAIPGISIRDSLKMADSEGFVAQSLDRTVVIAAQTPQIFSYSQLVTAYEKARAEEFSATDDAGLYERYIGKVRIVPGDYRNIKITTRDDLIIGESYLLQGDMNL